MNFQKVSGLPDFKPLPRLNLNGKRYYQLPDRSIVPSVTTLLGHFEEKGIRRWRAKIGYDEADRISEEARIKGEAYHSLIEDYLENNPIEDIMAREEIVKIGSDLSSKFLLTLPFLHKISNIHYQETCLYSSKMKIAGRCDVIAEYEGILSVIDFKTSRKIKKEEYIQNYFEQATCYSLMYEELIGVEVPQIVIMIAASDEVEGEVMQCFVRKTQDYKENLFKKIEAYHTGMEL
jgi:hypothetical protein